MISKASGIPVYKQIEARIRADIARGALLPGDKLPSEERLAIELGVARGSVRQALSVLSDTGTVRRVHGQGTFVGAPGREYRIESDHFISFLDELERAGGAVDTRILDRRVVAADGSFGALFTQGEPLFMIKRLRSRGARPLMYSEDFLPCALLPTAEHAYDGERSVYDFLERRCGLRVCTVKRVFRAVAAGDEAEALGLRRGAPIFHIVQQAFDELSRCVDCARLYFDGSAEFSVVTRR